MASSLVCPNRDYFFQLRWYTRICWCFIHLNLQHIFRHFVPFISIFCRWHTFITMESNNFSSNPHFPHSIYVSCQWFWLTKIFRESIFTSILDYTNCSYGWEMWEEHGSQGRGNKWQMFAARQPGLELITMQLNNTINAIKITIKHAALPTNGNKIKPNDWTHSCWAA